MNDLLSQLARAGYETGAWHALHDYLEERGETRLLLPKPPLFMFNGGIWWPPDSDCWYATIDRQQFTIHTGPDNVEIWTPISDILDHHRDRNRFTPLASSDTALSPEQIQVVEEHFRNEWGTP